MTDNRHWAKIDTSYIMNPKWFRVERFIGDHIELANGKTDSTCHQLAIANALRTARESHLASILYCSQNQTDGVFPVRAIKAVASVVTSDEETALTALFEVGLWINLPGGMAEVHDFLEHQTPASLTKKRSDAGKKGAATRWQNDGKSAQSANGKTMASANAEKKRKEENISNSRVLPEGANRTDIQEILDYLDAALKEAEIPLPSRTKTNLTAARLLLDKDGHTVDQVKAAIDFTFQDEFWRTNIRSMSKLREKWVQLRGAAQRKMPQAPQKPAVPDPYAYLEVSPPLTRGGSNG